MECGWVVTEEGRQPWVVYKLMTTAAAATKNGGVVTSLTVVLVVYAVLGICTVLILRMLAGRWRREDEPETGVPYGPPSEPTERDGTRVAV
jgi:cytochrome d ubiquinol oxidase subunit I